MQDCTPYRQTPSTRQLSSRDPITENMAVESAKLVEKFMAFQSKSSKDEKLDLQKYEPNIGSVVDMVTDVMNTWRSKRQGRKIAGYFLKFGRTLNSHKTMLEVLPQGSEYVSIFTGSLSAVIKVGGLESDTPARLLTRCVHIGMRELREARRGLGRISMCHQRPRRRV